MKKDVSQSGVAGAPERQAAECSAGTGGVSAVSGDGSASQPAKPWWLTMSGLLNAAAVLLIVAAGLFAVLRERPANEQRPWAASARKAASSASVAPAGPADRAVPHVVLAGPAEAGFDKYRPGTYTVLGIESQPRSSSHFVLRFRVRLLTRSGKDMNLSDAGFRLLIDGVPSAPDNDLNDPVPGNAAGEGTLSYQVPYGTHSLALRIIHHEAMGEIAELPLRVVAGEASGMTASAP